MLQVQLEVEPLPELQTSRREKRGTGFNPTFRWSCATEFCAKGEGGRTISASHDPSRVLVAFPKSSILKETTSLSGG